MNKFDSLILTCERHSEVRDREDKIRAIIVAASLSLRGDFEEACRLARSAEPLLETPARLENVLRWDGFNEEAIGIALKFAH